MAFRNFQGSSKQDGSMGIDIIRSTPNNISSKSKPEYVVIFRFNNYDNLAKWEKSPIRNEWLQKGRKLVESDPDVQKMTGLEFWFTPYFKDKSSSPIIPLNSPPRYKMVIVTIPVISILISTLVPLIHFLTEILLIPFPIRLVIAIAITVDLCDNASFNKIIKALAIQNLIKNALLFLKLY